MRKPSVHLRRQLQELNLCSPRQLAACEKQVNRLCEGLPEFDSVWLDVLVQRRVLSRFQADRLHQGRSDELQVGQLVLREQLADHSFLAATPVRQSVVIQERSELSGSERQRLSVLVESLHSDRLTAPPSLAVPIRVITEENKGADNRNFVAAPFHPGWTVAELIVRGGRLPWQSVLFIGHQLLIALEWLQSRGCRHGNIKSTNVRITREGRIVLVGALGSRFGDGGISLSSNLSYEDSRWLAPERVLNLQPTSFQSDLYSLASVLWNLLAGRDAFLSADPISRITRAGQENLPDIRTLVPDCPGELALALQRFSKSNPQLRPATPAESIELLTQGGTGNRQSLTALVKSLPDRSAILGSQEASSGSNSLLPTVTAAALMVAAFVGYGIQRGLIPSVASMSASAEALDENGGNGPEDLGASKRQVAQTIPLAPDPNQVLAMPQPDVAGVVVLQSGRTYQASDLRFPGVMHIETSGQESAKVLVPRGRTWQLSSRQLALSNVHILHHDRTRSTHLNSPGDIQRPDSPMAIQASADVISIRGCIVESALTDQNSVCLHWSAATGTTATILVNDCVFKSNGSAISTSVVPQRCELTNTLILVKRSAIRATMPQGSSSVWPMTLNRITQPMGLTFADFLFRDPATAPAKLIVTAGESVLAPTLALVQVASENNRAALKSQVEFRLPKQGNAVVVPPQIPAAVAWDRSLKAIVALPAENVVAASILPAQPVFRGHRPGAGRPEQNSWAAFALIDYEGPKLTSELPGVLIDKLPELRKDPQTMLSQKRLEAGNRKEKQLPR